MAIPISQRELRYDSGEIMRRVEAGESFVVTRDGFPVAELVPTRPRRFVPSAIATAAFLGADPVGAARFRPDVDAYLDQDPTPRGDHLGRAVICRVSSSTSINSVPRSPRRR